MTMHVSQATFQAVVIIREPFVIESEQVQNRRMQIVHRNDVLDRFVAEIVRCHVAETFLDSGSCPPYTSEELNPEFS